MKWRVRIGMAVHHLGLRIAGVVVVGRAYSYAGVAFIPVGATLGLGVDSDHCIGGTHVFRPAIMDGADREMACACGCFVAMVTWGDGTGAVNNIRPVCGDQ